MKPWPTSGLIMRSSSQKAREAMSSRNSLAASQRNLREGKEDLLWRLGGWRGPFDAETLRRGEEEDGGWAGSARWRGRRAEAAENAKEEVRAADGQARRLIPLEST